MEVQQHAEDMMTSAWTLNKECHNGMFYVHKNSKICNFNLNKKYLGLFYRVVLKVMLAPCLCHFVVNVWQMIMLYYVLVNLQLSHSSRYTTTK